MTHPRRHRGFGLIAAVLILAFAVVMATMLTAALVRTADRTSRSVQGVRSRALAEAGIEAALARLDKAPTGGSQFVVNLEGGTCKVFIAKAAAGAVVASTGRLALAGGDLTTTITLDLSLDPAPSRIAKRAERTEYIPRKADR